MLGIINYGSGNLSAFVNVYRSLEKKILIIEQPHQLSQCSHIILPGVSAWDTTMNALVGFKEELMNVVVNKKIPFLGVCVGMQVLASDSEEGQFGGLCFIEGSVRKIPFKSDLSFNNQFVGPRLPHMGWNRLTGIGQSDLLLGMEFEPEFYFLHSYYFDAKNSENVLASTNHNNFTFPVIVQNQNIFGVQFHPEKSQINGKILLDNFSKL